MVDFKTINDTKYDYFGQVSSKQKRRGFGRTCIHNGAIYEGFYSNGVLNGYGRLLYDGHYYEGYLKNHMKHGQGKKVHADGTI